MSTTAAPTRRVDITGSCFLDTSTPIDTIEKIKFIILFPFIILRVIGTFLVVLAAAGVGAVAGFGRKPGTPTPLWRRLIISLAVPVVRCLLLTWGFFYIRVEGREHLRKAMRERKSKPFIVLFNHVSLVDAPLVCWVLGMPGAVAKEEVQQYPIVKHFLSGLELVYVKRGPKNVLGAGGLTADIVKRVEDPRYLSPLCMAPEGTCGNGKCLIQFRTGAFVPGVAVLPLLIQYPHKRFNPAWTLQSAAITFFRILGQFYNNASLRFLPLYEPSEEERKDPTLYSRRVRTVMAKELGVPERDEVLEDSLVMIDRGIALSWDESKVIIPEGAVKDGRWLEYEAAARAGGGKAKKGT